MPNFNLALYISFTMNILIVAATDKEIDPLIEHLTLISEETAELKKYSFKKHFIDVLITGVGMVATTYHLGKTLTKYKYDFAVNLGIAGSFDKELKSGVLVNVEKDRFSEMGAEDNEDFLSLSKLALSGTNSFPFTKEELINTFETPNKSIASLKRVKGITVNKVHGNEKSIEKTVKLFSPQIESMEGAAFLYVCLMEKIPCAQIRAISNQVEKRNREAWNIPLAIESLNLKALEILNYF